MRKRKAAKAVAYALSAAMLAGSVSMSDSMVADAGRLMSLEEWQQSVSGNNVSGGDSVSGGNTVSGNNDIMLLNAEYEDYTNFTEDELVYSFHFGTDVTSSKVYGQWVYEDTQKLVNIGFIDQEYNEEAAGWVNNVYYPREISREEPGASYVKDGDGYLEISSKVWTEKESTGYGVYTYENTSAFSMELANADYLVEVNLVNPTDIAYNAYIEAEDITKISSMAVPAGGSAALSFKAVLVDGRLDLKFLAPGSATSADAAVSQPVYVSSLKITRLATEEAGSKPTVFIASDSTVQTYESNYYPQTGWGQTLALFFGTEVNEYECEDCNYSQAQTYETENVIVENRAIGGRSSKSFVEEGKLDDLLEDIKPGDYLLVQWGHNDSTYSRPNRYVSSADFEKWMQYYVDGALQRGATPVLVTPVARYSYTADSDGNLVSFASNFEAYRQVMMTMAEQQGLPLIDLTQRSIDLCNSFGIEGAKSLFLWLAAGEYPDGAYANGASDSTHLQYYGAYKFAQCVAKGILESDHPSLASLKEKVVMNVPANVPGTINGLTTTMVGASSVSMTWNADADAELYYIYRYKLGEGETAADVDFTNVTKYSVSSTTKYTDSNCEGGATYVYAVRGFNEKGLGELSEKIEVTTKSAGYRFDFNYNDSPTMEGWTGVNQSKMYDAQAGYGWIKAPGNGRYRNNNGNDDSSDMGDDFCLGAGEFAVDLPNGDYEVTVYAGDLLPGTSTIKPAYTAEGVSIGSISVKQGIGSCTSTVRITDGQLNVVVGGTNQYINGMTITELLLAPSGLTATEFSTDEETATVSFLISFNTVKEAARYNVYRKNSTDEAYSIVKSFTAQELVDLDLDCRSMTGTLGESYNYYITCVTSDGTESAPSNVLEVMLVEEGDPAPAPANLVCTSPSEDETQLQRSISLKWDEVEGAIKYIVFRSEKAEDEKGFKGFVKIGESASNVYTDEDGVATNIHYYYKVAALTKTGVGMLSEVCRTPVTGELVKGGMESYSDRAPVAIYLGGDDGAETAVTATDKDGNELTKGVYLSWRSYEADFDSQNNLTSTFDVYRGDTRIASNIKVTNLVDEGGSASDTYRVVGSNDASLGITPKNVAVWQNKYLELNLFAPADDTMPDGSTCSYSANDMSVGDLDGDGVLELIVKWYPSNAKDNSGSGYTGKTYLDAYDVDYNTGAASLMWRIDMGINIRSGAHYTQFQVWDYDGDGKAELAVKAADGTTSYVSEDGTAAGLVEKSFVGACSSSALAIDHINAEHDYRNSSGYVLDGPEYFAIFDDDGKLIDSVDYTPARGSVSAWGDAYGNRVDRFLSATAYLNGETPFAVFCRGYYTRTCLTAYYLKDTNGDNIGDKIDTWWTFDTDVTGTQYEAQGNHGLGVNDIDNDGKDEIIYGSLVIDHDGTVKYSTGLGHGDAMHISDWVSWNDGLEIMAVHEHDNAAYHVEIHDAETGEILMGYYTGKDTGRGVAADIDPTAEGAEWWSIASPTYEDNEEPEWDSTKGEVYSSWSTLEKLVKLSSSTPASNFSIFWDGDLLSEIQDHRFNKADYVPISTLISKWNYEEEKQETLLDSTAIWTNNGTKGTMGLTADILGDWREEIVTRTSADPNKVRIYSTTIQTDYVVPCLLEDLAYREAVAWQNVGYNQPANTSYLLSHGTVTAQLSNAEASYNSVNFQFTPASDGDLYGHDIVGYDIYRAEEGGEYELIDTLSLDELVEAGQEGGDSQKKDPVYLKFDFGSKALLEGWTQITSASQSYEENGEYGFTAATKKLGYSDKSYGNSVDEQLADMYNDCVLGWNATATYEFIANVPNDTYEVTMYSMNGSGSQYNQYTIEGTPLADVRKGKNTIKEDAQTVTVEVTDGTLNVTCVSSKSDQPAIYFNGLTIKSTGYDEWESGKGEQGGQEAVQTDYKFDFGSKALLEGWTQITSASQSYEENGIYGFTSASKKLGFSDKSYGNSVDEQLADMYNDCVLGWNDTATYEFIVNVPNGTYEVTMYSMNGSGSQYNQYTIEGTALTDIRKGKNEVREDAQTVTVDVTDGTLNVTCVSSKSGQPSIYFNGLTITCKELAETGDDTTGGNENAETNKKYVYTDKTVKPNTSYSYKMAARVSYNTAEGTTADRTSHMSRNINVKTAIQIASVKEFTLKDLVVGMPVPEGETAACYLPKTLSVTDADGNDLEADVIWDVSELDLNMAGSYSVTAKIAGWDTPVVKQVKVVENQIAGFEPMSAIDVVQGMEAQLPETVKVLYTNTTTEDVKVVWDTEGLNTDVLGKVTVYGTLQTQMEGLADKPSIEVNVIANYITSVSKLFHEVEINSGNVEAIMPGKVSVTWANGAVTQETVSWKDLSSVDVTTAGTYQVEGVVNGFEDSVFCEVYVAYPLVGRFDFGIDSKYVAEGFNGITVNPRSGKKTVSELGGDYTAEKGYGFANPKAVIEGRKESYTQEGILPAEVYHDFVIPDGQTFLVDVKNGKYEVQISSGSYYKSSVKSTVEGVALNVSNSAETYVLGSVIVDVTDGQLTIEFAAGNTSRVNAVIVRKVSEAEEPVNRDELEGAINDAKALIKTDYTAESYSKLAEALKEAEGVFADKDATQEQVNAQVEKIKAAVEGLEVDSAELAKAIEEAKALTKIDYTAASYAELTEVLAKAEEVLKNKKAAKSEVDAQTAAVKAAVAGLEVNKAELAQSIEEAKALSEDKYTADSYAEVVKALAEAEKVMKNDNATRAEAVAAAQALDKAISALVEKSEEPEAVDRTELEKAVNDAGAVDGTKYTAESYAAFTSALNHAKEVLKDEQASQSEIDSALKALEQAKAALAENSGNNGGNGDDTDDNNNNGGNDTDNGSNDNSEDGNADNGDEIGTVPADSNKKSPATYDNTPFVPAAPQTVSSASDAADGNGWMATAAVAAVIAALFSGIVVYRKRKEEE